MESSKEGRQRRHRGIKQWIGRLRRLKPEKCCLLNRIKNRVPSRVALAVATCCTKEGSGMEQHWFEMKGVWARKLNDAVWIPLRASSERTEGKYGYLGYKSELFAQSSEGCS